MTDNPENEPPLKALMIVAHPDDETLWAGGWILTHPEVRWEIVALTRASDPDRAPRFARLLEAVSAAGRMADLDDGPEQHPLDDGLVQRTILELAQAGRYDLLITHGPHGEYTRHRRHEEVARAVCGLWSSGRLEADELRLFAYDDDGGAHLPRLIEGADVTLALERATWEAKRRLITEIYGFAEDSWEARTTPRREGFWSFRSAGELETWLKKMGDPEKGLQVTQ